MVRSVVGGHFIHPLDKVSYLGVDVVILKSLVIADGLVLTSDVEAVTSRPTVVLIHDLRKDSLNVTGPLRWTPNHLKFFISKTFLLILVVDTSEE